MLCPLCPHGCRLTEGGPPGLCRARALREGRIAPINYGLLSALQLDPIEKKPLYTFHPGSRILSVGSFGCNMACYFCQNASIATARLEDGEYRNMDPESLVALADSLRDEGNIGIAFTYNEPLIGYEYMIDCARLMRPRGLKCVAVTNGCFHVDAIAPLFPWVDAYNIDLKGFNPAWYRRLGGDLETVKAFITRAQENAHVELTCLVVPGENDSKEEIAALAAWVASLSPDIPLHLSRFFPRHKAMDARAGSVPHLKRLREVASRHLRRVYLGNV